MKNKVTKEMKAFIVNESKKRTVKKESPQFVESVKRIVKDVQLGKKVVVVDGKLFSFSEQEGRLVSEEI